jgi:hypothetical protein
MNEKTHENIFKFGLYQGNSIISERIFSADVYNPVIRYSVDIRSIIPTIISKLQKTLSKRDINFIFQRGGVDNNGNELEYELLNLYKKTLDGKVSGYVNKLTRPEVVTQTINKKTISGVECKFGLYINDNPIVERIFYVDNYNPASRFSIEIIDVVNDICEELQLKLKTTDINHMWGDYDLIKTYGLYINQVRELSKETREKMLYNIKYPNYVKQNRFQGNK